MKIEEFEDLVDRLGEDISRWPEQFRKVGEALLATSAEAREIVREASLLRRALSRDDSARSPAGLADRIVGQARSDGAVPQFAFSAVKHYFAFWDSRFPLWSRPSVLLPLCFAIGLMIGLFSAHSSSRGTSQIDPPAFFQGCCGNWSVGRDG